MIYTPVKPAVWTARLLFIAFLLSPSVMAQTIVSGSGEVWTIQSVNALETKYDFMQNARDQLKAYRDLQGGQNVVLWQINEQYVGEPEQRRSLVIEPDGSLTLKGNWTEHEWLLMFAGQTAERHAESDRRIRAEFAALKDTPPAKLVTRATPVKVRDVNRWSPYIEADANCLLHRIRIVNTEASTDKRVSLIHEMMHVSSNCSQNEQLHRAIQQIAPKFLELMRNNPDTVAWLMKQQPKEPK